jgi:hypothetical protein
MCASELDLLSVLPAGSVVHDRHGVIPKLLFSVKGAVKITLFNLSLGPILGLALFATW